MSSTGPLHEETAAPVSSAAPRKSANNTLMWVLVGGGAILMACVCVAFAGIAGFFLFFSVSRSTTNQVPPASQPAITVPANPTPMPAAPSEPANVPEGGSQPAAPQVGLEVGNLAPDFELAGLDGKTHRLSEFRGRPVLLNFWATWCGPCQEEMPAISKKYEEYKDQDFIVLAVDVNEGPDLARPYARRYNLPFLFLDDHDGQVSNTYRIRALPTSVFIDADGIVQMRVLGSMSENRIQLGIDSVMR